MRRLATALLGLSTLMAVPAHAQDDVKPTRHVEVLQVSGLIDPVIADSVEDVIRKADRTNAVAVLLQVNSTGGVLSRAKLDDVRRSITASPVPVAVWVGESGARAYGQAFDVVEAARFKGVAPGTRVGEKGASVDDEAALEQGLVEFNAPTIGDFLVQLDDRGLDTAEVVQRGGQPRRQLVVRVVNAKPGLVAQLLHTAASPSVALLMLVMGIALVILEFYTAGIGVAAATGVMCLALSAYGLAVLPTRPWALALVLVGMFGYAVDLQAGTPRTWTVIGTAGTAIGAVALFDGHRAGWLALVATVGGIALFMVAGMPAMVRARFSTPTIGRESIVGELGTATSAVNPEGVVEVRGAPWRARTNRATPLEAGQSVRVVGIDGLLLEVEPESGGARDYRERSTTHGAQDPPNEGKTAGHSPGARES